MSVGAAGVVNVRDTNIFKRGIQNLVAMHVAVHPPIHHGIDSSESPANNFTRCGGVVTGFPDTLGWVGTIRADMACNIILCHVGAVATRSLDELVVCAVGGKAVAAALLVDAVENGRIHPCVTRIQRWVRQTAGAGCRRGWRCCRRWFQV